MKRLITLALLGAVSTTLLAGCVAVVKDQPANSRTPTTGQQLIDLKHARDAGAISDEEYQAQRARILGKG